MRGWVDKVYACKGALKRFWSDQEKKLSKNSGVWSILERESEFLTNFKLNLKVFCY